MRTGKKTQTYLSNLTVTHIEMIDAIVKQEGVPASEIILIIDDKPLTKVHLFKLDGGKKTEIIFIKKYNYKDVVFTQQANGVWSDRVLAMTNFKTLEAL